MARVVEVEAPDRRVQRSQQALVDAFFELLVEKGDFGAVSVAAIAHRANVGRSTFYAHFVDKEDLLLNGLRHLEREILSFERPASAPRCCHPSVAFMLPMLTHAQQNRRLAAVLGGPAGVLVREQLLETFERLALGGLRTSPARQRATNDVVVARFLAGGFQSVLGAWLQSACAQPVLELEIELQHMVRPLLAAAGYEPS